MMVVDTLKRGKGLQGQATGFYEMVNKEASTISIDS